MEGQIDIFSIERVNLVAQTHKYNNNNNNQRNEIRFYSIHRMIHARRTDKIHPALNQK